MTQEDKNILLKDLCGRLPYGVMMKVSGLSHPIALDEFILFTIRTSKQEGTPYLRPMSSMTEEEKKEYEMLTELEYDGYLTNGKLNYTGETVVYVDDAPELVDFYNGHHFDYRGLIEKGLALEAPENMYKIE